MSVVELDIPVLAEVLVRFLAGVDKGAEICGQKEVPVAERVAAESSVSADLKEGRRPPCVTRGEEGFQCPAAEFESLAVL